MFSLCIPTKDRFPYLIKTLPMYIANEYISEIIICDENGNDSEKIKKHFSLDELNKVQIFVNQEVLGAFLNKINCCKKAQYNWIALIDSAKFADRKFFEFIKDKIEHNTFHKSSIIAPFYENDKLRDSFQDIILSKRNFLTANIGKSFSSGNFIINKYLIDNLEITDEIKSFNPFCYDILYILYLFMKEFDNFEMFFYKNIHYQHTVTKDSLTVQSFKQNKNQMNNVKKIIIEKIRDL